MASFPGCEFTWRACAYPRVSAAVQQLSAVQYGHVKAASYTCRKVNIIHVVRIATLLWKVFQNAPESISERLKLKNFLGGHAPRPP